ncbi:acetylglutamate kinase [Candidatus Gracilibacteria bacterium]|nr:acetylglutamate kinase [Candidatus Gracilibacteria bacterium]
MNDHKSFYYSQFKGKVFVIKIGGEVVASKDILENILIDVVELMAHGIHVVFVHGGGSQADDLSKKLGHETTKIDGRRVTGEKDLEVVKMLFGGSLNLDILSILKKLGAKGLRVSGLDGGLLDVKMREKGEHDFGFVGDVEKVHPKVLVDLMNYGYLPVVSPLGVTDDGTIVNINADTIATEIAISLNASKLILFTTTDGIFNGKDLIHTLTLKESQKLIDDKIVKDGMLVKLVNCMQAVEAGVQRVHVLNGLHPHSLVAEVCTKSGVGTMIISGKEKEKYLNE